MAEFVLIGVLCVFNPFTGAPNCFSFAEDPIIYYTKEACEDTRVKKTKEIADNMTSKGIQIIELNLACVVDNNSKNTWFYTYKLIRLSYEAIFVLGKSCKVINS